MTTWRGGRLESPVIWQSQLGTFIEKGGGKAWEGREDTSSTPGRSAQAHSRELQGSMSSSEGQDASRLLRADLVHLGCILLSPGGFKSIGPGGPGGLMNGFEVWPKWSGVTTAPQVVVRYNHSWKPLPVAKRWGDYSGTFRVLQDLHKMILSRY